MVGVDVDDMIRMDVIEDNEENMANMWEGHEGLNTWHNEFEEASKVLLFEDSTFSNFCATLFIMNCCHTHGTSNAFIIELLGLLKKMSYLTQIHYLPLNMRPLAPWSTLG
jgi:hypothetical protein